MTLIDTHSHIYLEEFDQDRAAMLERAGKEGVEKILLPAIDSGSHDRLLELETANSNCRAMMGLHPCSVKENVGEELKIVREWFGKRAFVAVGEIGLDFYWDRNFTEQQYQAFRQQLELSIHYKIPVSIHSRNATDECIQVVSEFSPQGAKGVFHCFSGDLVQAHQVIDLGFYLGIGGVLTFKNSGLDKLMAETGLEHIVLETDAPYLAPLPFRGKRNEPAYLKYVVQKLSEIKQLDKEEIARITTGNAKKLFRSLGHYE